MGYVPTRLVTIFDGREAALAMDNLDRKFAAVEAKIRMLSQSRSTCEFCGGALGGQLRCSGCGAPRRT